ncbi:amidohydrolase [Microvirga sp. 17 mud 1-3]|uniref:amidohydrolase n=1 Tax=Microvirga sp. 17 mud 1-3 TaxID=2082949 RepID=UPI000D6C691D|nr:amidohydrolase [Microvirga sp. 17 mud 1-3]AWM87408.1 amidohydrolase [Microvirga sp. 17 mud 1-3]
MFLTNQDVIELTAWRRRLHQMPELSGEEAATAREVEAFLASAGADRIVTGLGGHGVAAIYEGREPGPSVMIRAELDGLPIEEIADIPHRSTTPGKAHLCGHDGHMAILAALARGLGRNRPQRGRAILMFQPAEENGAGAAAVVADPRYSEITPDFAFALHNLPGLPLGKAALIAGPVSCASRGMRIVLTGKTAHASMPEFGLSPVEAVAALMPALTALGRGGPLDEGFTMVTVTHARVGEPAFGIAPGRAEIWATLRTLTDAGMKSLCGRAEALATEVANGNGLGLEITYHDVFRHCENAPEAVAHLGRALDAEGVQWDQGDLPMRPSEDFGHFGDKAALAMFFLGAGENHPSLHNPDYDFPDDLIGIGARVFMRTLRDLLG